MTTFSQLVDALVAETRRPDMLPEIIMYANQTIREVHFAPSASNSNGGGAVMFRDNFREVLLTANVTSGFSWNIPDPATFQAMQVVQYGVSGIYPPEKIPSRALAGLTHYYYRAGSSYVFSGYAGINDRIAVGFFQYPRRLVYYAAGARPATYDPDLGWNYQSNFAATEELRFAAQEFTSNWLLLRWIDVISEGIRAKIYKRVSDDGRAKTCYSMYMSMRQGLVSSESADLGGFS